MLSGRIQLNGNLVFVETYMKILVRNLDRLVTQPELEALFQPFGHVESCVLVMDEKTGKSKGFGFVEMPNPRDAIKAIKGLNTLKVRGYGIRVKAAESAEK